MPGLNDAIEIVLSGLTTSVVRAKKPVGSLADTVNSISEASGNAANSSTIYAKELGGTTKALGRVAAAATSLHAALNDLSRFTLAREDDIKAAMRGTASMSKALTAGYAESVRESRVFATSLQTTMRIPLQEASKMAVGLQDSFAKAGKTLDSTAAETVKYATALAVTQKVTGMTTDEMVLSQKLSVNSLNQGMDESIDLARSLTAATVSFGISGSKATQAVQDRVEELQMLDVEDRDDYAQKLIFAAGIQEKAARDFGKFASSLAKATGADAMRIAATLAAYTGRDSSDVAALMQKARFDANAQLELIRIKEEAVNTVSPGFVEDQKKALKGELSGADATKHLLQQELVSKVIEPFGDTIDTLSNSIEAAKRAAEAKPAVEEYNKALDRSATQGGDSFFDKLTRLYGKDSLGELSTTDEMAHRAEGLIAEALEPLNKLNNVLRFVNSSLKEMWHAVDGVTALLFSLGGGFLLKRGVALATGASRAALASSGLSSAAATTSMASRVAGASTATASASTAASTMSAAGKFSKFAGRAGEIGMVIDLGIGGYRTIADRDGLRAENNERSRREGLSGVAQNFWEDLSPGSALARSNVLQYDAIAAVSDALKSKMAVMDAEKQFDQSSTDRQNAFKAGQFRSRAKAARNVDAISLHKATLLAGHQLSSYGIETDYAELRNTIYDAYNRTGKLDPASVVKARADNTRMQRVSVDEAERSFNLSTDTSIKSLQAQGLDLSKYDGLRHDPIKLDKIQSRTVYRDDDKRDDKAPSQIPQQQAPIKTPAEKLLERIAALMSENNQILRDGSMGVVMVN